MRPATLLKKILWRRCFPVNFAKFLRTSFLQNTYRRLLLFLNSLSTDPLTFSLANFLKFLWKTFPFFSLLLETCLEPRQTSRMEHFSENSWRLKVAKEKNSVIDLWQCFKYTTDYNMFKTVQLILWMPDNLVLLYAVPENILRNLLNINWNIEIAVDAFSCRITKIFHGEFNHLS